MRQHINLINESIKINEAQALRKARLQKRYR